MDNKGGAGIGSGENVDFLAPAEMPSGPVENLDQVPDNPELPQDTFGEGIGFDAEGAPAHEGAEQGPEPVPEIEQQNNEIEDPEIAKVTAVPVKSNPEMIPKDYAKAFNNLVREKSKDPSELCAAVDVARWDFMTKAFNRKRGDGLNGEGAKAA